MQLWNTLEQDLPYLTQKFRSPTFAPDAGIGMDELEQGILKCDDDHPGESRRVIKALAFQFTCRNIQIDLNPHDFFPGLGDFERYRRAIRVLVYRWRNQVERDLNRYTEQLKQARATGIYNGWKDFDHSVPDWEYILPLGFPGILQSIRDSREQHRQNGTLDENAQKFFEGLELTYTSILEFLERLIAWGKAHPAGPRVEFTIDCLQALHDHAPSNFYEVLQFIFLYFFFSEQMDMMQCRSLGQIDAMLLPFYKKDLADGRFTQDQMRELFDHFLMQWGSLDNYWGQPIYMGGTAPDGSTEYNELSPILLEEFDRMKLPTPKLQLKIAPNTPQHILDQALNMVRSWNASIVFLGEQGIRHVARSLGFSEEDARICGIRGCYEFFVRGKSNGTGPGHINLLKGIELALNDGLDPKTGIQIGPHTGTAESFASYEDFRNAVLTQLGQVADNLIQYFNDEEKYLTLINPANVLTPTLRHAMERLADGFADGYDYNDSGILLTGLGTATDALMAVKRFVYEQKQVSLPALRNILLDNWEGHEKLRHAILNDPYKFGNGLPEVDEAARSLGKFVCDRINGKPNARGGVYHASGHCAKQFIYLGEKTGATPDGRKAGEEMSKNLSPTMGMDRNGVTALLHSLQALDSADYPGDFPLDVMLHPTTVQGEDGLAAFRAIVLNYHAHNGLAIHFNIYNEQKLLDAQAHPEKYPNLQVRVCGWNVRWADMAKVEQDEYIKRARLIAQ